MKIGIAFGGGGTRAFAHLGALKYLEEAGIHPSIVSGTSAGSIVGLLVAAGFSSDNILELVKISKFIDFAKVSLPSTGIFTLSNLRKLLERLLPAKEFSDLKIPFYAAVTNLYSGKAEYINEGPLITAVEASCSIPVIFAPVVMNGQLYVDGGVLDSIPVTPLIGKCDKIIALSAGAKGEVKKVGNLKEAGLRAFDLLTNRDASFARQHADLLLEPEGLGAYRTLDTRHTEDIYALGYECAKKADLSRFISKPRNMLLFRRSEKSNIS
jgi:NTE family protein